MLSSLLGMSGVFIDLGIEDAGCPFGSGNAHDPASAEGEPALPSSGRQLEGRSGGGELERLIVSTPVERRGSPR